MNTFYVEKSSGTQADVLVAYGLAEIITQVVSVQAEVASRSYNVQIHDEGGCYRLTCDPPLDLDALDSLGQMIQPAPLLVTVKNQAQLDLVSYDKHVDYEKEKQQRNEYLDFRKQNKTWDKLPVDQRPTLPTSPHPDWDIFRAINPAALPGYNNVLVSWAKATTAQPDVLRILFGLFSDFPNNLDQATKDWKALDKQHGWGIGVETTTLQLYNPDQGKGQNRTKADSLTMANVSGFWLLELLKITGLYRAGITRTLAGVKDRKNYIVAPTTLNYSESNQVMDKFKKAFQSHAYPAITSDIVALIAYVEALFVYAEERPEVDWLPRKRKLRNIVKGFHTAFYKDLGNAVATMNVSFLALPSWITVEKTDDIIANRDLLEEVRRLTYTIDESHSDGYTLLGRLRDFLSGGELSTFFEFTASYVGYYMSQRERGKFAHQLSVLFVRTIIMENDSKLAAILENEGFQNIAYAIRQSTVTAQYRKMNQRDRRYEIRYGLGQDLLRKARYNEEFVTALSNFLSAYNAETVQVAERSKAMGRNEPGRRTVRTADVETIVWLIDTYGAPLIANMLIAYGYATLGKSKVSEPEQPNQPNDDFGDSADSSADDSE